jgi:hypothetical protein
MINKKNNPLGIENGDTAKDKVTGLEHSVRFEKGYDCIRFECINDSPSCKHGSGGTHGKHGMNISFIVKGDEGAIQFVIYTGWIPQHAKKSTIGTLNIRKWSEEPPFDSCDLCDDEPCYYDGSSLNAELPMYVLVNGGDEALWKYLEDYYHATFNDGKYPELVEYEKPLRT